MVGWEAEEGGEAVAGRDMNRLGWAGQAGRRRQGAAERSRERRCQRAIEQGASTVHITDQAACFS